MAGRKPSIRPIVVAHLLKHAGKPVQADEMAAATGLTVEQIQGQMRNMVSEGAPVRTIVRARMWVYEPETTPEPEVHDVTGEIFEGIGRTRSGAVIVRDGSGVLYVAREMDV